MIWPETCKPELKKKKLQFPTQNLIIIHCVLLTETELYTTEKADIS